MTTSPSAGLFLGLPVAVLAIAGFVTAATLLLRLAAADSFDQDAAEKRGGAGLFILLATTLTVILAVGFYPYSWEYHSWRPVSGTVDQVNSRLIAGDNSTDQKFVVVFTGDRTPYGVTDTRMALIHSGDQLSITCKKSFQWFGTPSDDCEFVDYTPAKG